LGDFSPTGRLFEFLEHDKQPNIFGYFYLPKYGKSNAGFFTKNGQGDILGDIFLQTHLVTVVSKDATFIFSGNRPLTHSLRICRLKPEAVCCAGTGSGSGCGGAA
jgi:hypothetical protein